MAMHTIIEINHDLFHKSLTDNKFAQNLYNALAGLFYKDNILDQNERILRTYGIKILNQHHSSEEFKVVKQP